MTSQIALETEIAWRMHDPRQGRVPTAIWRRLAAIKKQLEGDVVRIEQHLFGHDNLPGRMVIDALRKRGKGRMRALTHLMRACPGVQIEAANDEVIIRFLVPDRSRFKDPRDPGESQDHIDVILTSVRHLSPLAFCLISGVLLDVSDHAAARLLQRAPDADFAATLFAAAEHLACADAQTFYRYVGDSSRFYLPAADGVLACDAIEGHVEGNGKILLFGRARTFLDMQTPAPIPLAADADDRLVNEIFRREVQRLTDASYQK